MRACPSNALRHAILNSQPAQVQQALQAGARLGQVWQGMSTWVHAALGLLPRPSLALDAYPDPATPAPSRALPAWAHAQWEAAQEEHDRLRRAREVLIRMRWWKPWPVAQEPRLLVALAQHHPKRLTQPDLGAPWKGVLPLAAPWPSVPQVARAQALAREAEVRTHLADLQARQVAQQRALELARQPTPWTGRSRSRV